MQEVTILDPYARPFPPVEQRSTYADPADWMFETFAGGKSTAGERVSSKTAMGVMAFFACVRNISEDIAKLPKKVRKDLNRGSDNQPDHPVQFLLDEPNEETDCHTFWQTLVAHACVHHGGFAEIIRNGAGEPMEMHLLDPDSVRIFRSGTGRIAYHIWGMPENQGLSQANIFHLHGLGHDGMAGYNIPSIAKQLLGAAQAMQKYRGAFFGNGATPTGALKFPKPLSKEAQERLKNQFVERHTGAEHAHKPMFFEEGLEWVQISIDPERAQLESLTNVTTEDICRIFRMPPHKIGHLARSTNNNIEHQGLEYDRDCLDPWADKLRRECERKFFTRIERRAGYKVYINLKGVLRGDLAARTAHYKDMFYMGAMTPNEIRELEDMNPYPEGDRYYMQQNLAPVDRLDEIIDKQTAEKEPKPAPAQLPAPKPEDAQARIRASFEMLLANRIENILRIEADKAKRGKNTPEFWEQNTAYVAGLIKLDIDAVSVGLGRCVDVSDLSKEYGAAHSKASQQDIAAGDLTHWHNGERARAAAKALIYRIENAPKEEPCPSDLSPRQKQESIAA